MGQQEEGAFALHMVKIRVGKIGIRLVVQLPVNGGSPLIDGYFGRSRDFHIIGIICCLDGKMQSQAQAQGQQPQGKQFFGLLHITSFLQESPAISKKLTMEFIIKDFPKKT